METVTAIVVSYWWDRRKNISKIVQAFESQSRPPDNIIIVNNGAHMDPIGSARVINCSDNFYCRAKYAGAMLIPSDYYAIVDDDYIPQHNMISGFMKWAKPGCCMSNYGIKMTNNIFHTGKEIKAENITEPEPVDAFIGIVQFLSFNSIINYFKAEEKVRLPNKEYLYDGEDILMGMANPSALVVPIRSHYGEAADFVPDSQTESMQGEYGYYSMRDVFAFDAWQKLGRSPYPGFIPGDDNDQHAIEIYRDLVKKREGKWQE